MTRSQLCPSFPNRPSTLCCFPKNLSKSFSYRNYSNPYRSLDDHHHQTEKMNLILLPSIEDFEQQNRLRAQLPTPVSMHSNELAKIDDPQYDSPPIILSSPFFSNPHVNIVKPIPIQATKLSQTNQLNAHEGFRDYDDVADCAALAKNSNKQRNSNNKVRSSSDEDSNLKDEVLELRERVTEVESKISSITSNNSQILKLVSGLQITIEKLHSENMSMRQEMSRLMDSHQQMSMQKRLPSPMTHSQPPASIFAHNGATSQSMIERASSMPKQTLSDMDDPIRRVPRTQKGSTPTGRRSADHQRENERRIEVERLRDRERERESREKEMIRERDRERERALLVERERGDQFSNKEYAREHAARIQDIFQDSVFPDNIVIETERLTQLIRVVLKDAQNGDLQPKAPAHAHKICTQVNQMLAMVPTGIPAADEASAAMTDATMLLAAKCNSPNFNSESTCQAAYGLAKAAKTLLQVFTPMN